MKTRRDETPRNVSGTRASAAAASAAVTPGATSKAMSAAASAAAFLAGAPEDQRIATFQPHHAFAFAGQADEQGIDVGLRGRSPRLGFANGETFGARRSERNDFTGHQPVMDNRIGRLDDADGTQRQ